MRFLYFDYSKTLRLLYLIVFYALLDCYGTRSNGGRYRASQEEYYQRRLVMFEEYSLGRFMATCFGKGISYFTTFLTIRSKSL